MSDFSIRFKAFYIRLLDVSLIYRKITVTQMLFTQNELKEEFNKLGIENLNPDERIVSILKFIEKNHRGIFKCVMKELRYCVKMVSTG